MSASWTSVGNAVWVKKKSQAGRAPVWLTFPLVVRSFVQWIWLISYTVLQSVWLYVRVIVTFLISLMVASWSGLIAQMAWITGLPCIYALCKCEFLDLPMKRWDLFPQVLNLDWPWDLLWSVEFGEKDDVLSRLWSLSLEPLVLQGKQAQVCLKKNERYVARSPTAPGNTQQQPEAEIFPAKTRSPQLQEELLGWV